METNYKTVFQCTVHTFAIITLIEYILHSKKSRQRKTGKMHSNRTKYGYFQKQTQSASYSRAAAFGTIGHTEGNRDPINAICTRE